MDCKLNKSIEQRYVPHSQLLSLHRGNLHYGEDVSLRRPVILFTAEYGSAQSAEAYTQKFRKTASFNHDGFHHILDTFFAESSVLIVLQYRPGRLLREELDKKRWTFPEAISLVTDLGVSMLDAMEEQITGFSIGVDNLWLSEDGRLSVINYWEEGEPQTQGAIGLCRLFTRLLSGSAEIPGPFEALHTHLERTRIPMATPEQKDALVKLIKRVSQGQASLSSLVFELRGLPAANRPDSEEIKAPPLREAVPADDDETDEEPARPGSRRLGLSLGAVAFLAAVVVVWALWPSGKSKEHVTVPPSASAKPAASPSPAHTPEIEKKQTTAGTGSRSDGTGQTEEVLIPNLVGMTQADAESQALTSGLHYEFYLEASDKADGSVFKQDPPAGTKAYKGDNVTFWISKNSQ